MADIVVHNIYTHLASAWQYALVKLFTLLLDLGRRLLVAKVLARPSVHISCPQVTINTKEMSSLYNTNTAVTMYK